MNSSAKEIGQAIASELPSGKTRITNALTKSNCGPDSANGVAVDQERNCQDGICMVTWKPSKHAA